MPDGTAVQALRPTSQEIDSAAQLQKARRQGTAAGAPTSEETGSNLNIIELTLALLLALGVDFGIGWAGGILAAGVNAIPFAGQAISGMLMILIRITTLGTAMILGLWCLLRLKKFPWKRFGTSSVIEAIPFIGDLAPGWTTFVASVIFTEKIQPMLAKHGAPAAKIAQAIPTPQTQAVAKGLKVAEVASKVAAKT